jgi:hypothetical protein
MAVEKWEYKVAFVDRWERTSIEGEETQPEEGERNSAFGRRFLNGLGVDGWELVGIQHTRPGSAYYIFKRALAEGAEPDVSVKRREQPQQPQQPQQPTPPSTGPTTPLGPSGPVVSV